MMVDVDGVLCNQTCGEGQFYGYLHTRVVAPTSRVLLIIGGQRLECLVGKHSEAEIETRPRQGLRRHKELRLSYETTFSKKIISSSRLAAFSTSI